MIYYDLTIPLRCIVILILFLEFCFGAYTAFISTVFKI